MAVDDIYDAASKCGYDAGKIITMTRDNLEWMLTIAEDGVLLEGRLLPVLFNGLVAAIQQTNCQRAAPAKRLAHSIPGQMRLEHHRSACIDGPVEVRPGPQI